LAVYRKGFDHWFNAVFVDRELFYANTNVSSWNLIDSFWQGETQLSWFCGRMPDLVVHLENLNEEFKQVQELVGCYISLPHVNQAKYNDYKSYYNPTSINQVREIFAKDLTAFGYDF
jgi:hypothetical protein